jgi:acetylornithine deacetylase/succinyl-diaminopimelate desuccinylase-like protein
MTPSLGKNAISMMSKIIENLDRLEELLPQIDPPFTLEELKSLLTEAFPSREILDRIYNDQPLFRDMVKSLTGLTKSLNVIKGGTKANVIPDHCEALIDFRLLPGQDSKMILEGLKKLISEIGFDVKVKPEEKPAGEVFVYLEIFNEGASSIWKDYDKSEAVKDLKKIVEKVYGRKSFYFLSMGATDAHFYRNNKYCESTIHYGPGSAGQMHTVDEYIEIQDFINAIKVYTLFAYNYLKK